jgi:hypothetical protein
MPRILAFKAGQIHCCSTQIRQIMETRILRQRTVVALG